MDRKDLTEGNGSNTGNAELVFSVPAGMEADLGEELRRICERRGLPLDAVRLERSAAPQAPGALPQSSLQAFAARENFDESRVQDALLQVQRMTQEPRYAEIWQEAWGRTAPFDGASMDVVTGNAVYVDRMVNSAQRYLNEILTRSTFMHLGSAAQVQIVLEAAVRGERNFLSELVRHLRSALDTKIFLNAVRHIRAEREARLMRAFGLESPHQIIPDHRFQYRSYDVVTPAQMQAYMEGDRSENVFGIGEWTKSPFARDAARDALKD
jgi:hypothetical protein